MTADNKRWLVSGLASAAVLVLAVAVLFNVGNPPVGTVDGDVARLSPGDGLEEVVVTARREASPQFGGAELRADAPAARVEEPGFQRDAQAYSKALPAPMPGEPPPAPGFRERGRDRFENVDPSPVKLVAEEPVSTFSADVDTASYSFVRRQLNQGVLPQKDAVRVEELINYFDYDYPQPDGRDDPLRATVAVMDSPWRPGNKLVHVGIRGYDIPRDEVPASNLVFLLDVSGSMNSPDKLPLVKQSLGLLLGQLKPTDTVAIVAYAGAAGTVLEPTQAKERQKILAAMERLGAGGSTAGGDGIRLAYQLARANFDKNAVNRVILATDGDFNVGITSREELEGFVARQRDEGIYLSVLGFGQGNYHDHMMQVLAQNGNGVAAYIDTLGEAQKVLVDQATATLFPIATDVKLQMEFNPATVREYRLLGYETRALAREDFNNDRVDAGDMGAGHRVTAIYEITPVGADSGLIEPSRYGDGATHEAGAAEEYGYLKMRFKLPGESRSRLTSVPVLVDNSTVRDSPVLAREAAFATAVAGFGELLRGGQYTGDWSWQDAIDLANGNRGDDPYGYRAEFVQLVRKASVAQAMR